MLRDFRISSHPHWRLARSLYRPRSGCGSGDASGLALGARRAVVHRWNHGGHRSLAHRVVGGHVRADCRAPQLAGHPATVRRRVLIWMGIQSVRSGFSARRAPSRVVGTENSAPTAEPPEAAAAAQTKLPVLTAGRSFRLGLYTNLSNPKALVFFGAVFAQFIRPEISIAWTFAVGIILLVISGTWFVIVTLIVRTFSTWLAKYSPLIDIIAGAIFILLGIVMVYEGIIQLF